MDTGRIIRILDDHTVVMNLGRIHDVKEKMRFGIYTPSDEIMDPETNESLGSYRQRKGVVVVDDVHERFAIASTPPIQKEVVKETGMFGLGTSKQRETRTFKPSLSVSQEQISGLPDGDQVAVGDTVEYLES